LRHNLGAPLEIQGRDLDRLDLDLDPPTWVLSALHEHTGVPAQDLRLMTIAGWVPWLLDNIHPDEGTDAFTTYVRQASVLLPPRRAPIGSASNWRAWLPTQLPTVLMSRACRQCVSDPGHGLTLMAKIPLMLSCPEHGCRLEPVLGHPVEHLIWSPWQEPEAVRPVTAEVLAMDRLTDEGLRTGTVHLPRRPVHVGVWLRLLRTLLDEVAAGSTRIPPSKADELQRIWRETGHLFRDGLGQWKPYETLGWPRQQAMLEAAAMAMKLITDGQIQARGTLGHLLTVGPDVPVFDGDPPRVDHWKVAMSEISAMIESAQHDPAIARQLVAFFSIGGRSRSAYERAQHLLIDAGVPARFIPSFGEYLCADHEAEAALRSR
jgi:hypothetical protein